LPSVGFRLLFVLVILRHERRRLISLSVTDYPTADWIARQLTDAFPWDEAPDYMIRDRDGCYDQAVTKRLAAMGIRDHPIAARSPWQNGHAERLIGSIRRECLDHTVVIGEGHLRRILATYAAYYNELRTHLALDKDSPDRRPIQRLGQLVASSAGCTINTAGRSIQQGQPPSNEALQACLVDAPRLGKDAKGSICLLAAPIPQPLPERPPGKDAAMHTKLDRSPLAGQLAPREFIRDGLDCATPPL
jgi:hypothetical protein